MYDRNKIEEKTKIALEMLSTIKKIKNGILRSEYIKLLAERIAVHENILLKELQNIKDSPTTNEWFLKKSESPPKQYPQAERMLVRLVLDDAEVIESVEKFLLPADFQDKRLQYIISTFIDHYKAHDSIKPHQIINFLDDDIYKKIICELTSDDTLSYKRERRDIILQDCISRIKTNCLNVRCQNILTQLKQAQINGDNDNLNCLQEEFNALMLLKRKVIANEKIRN